MTEAGIGALLGILVSDLIGFFLIKRMIFRSLDRIAKRQAEWYPTQEERPPRTKRGDE